MEIWELQTFPVKLRPRRGKWTLLLLGSLMVAGAGALIAPRDPLLGYTCLIVFGLGAVMATLNLCGIGSYLILSAEGFTFSNLFRKVFVPWSQVEAFRPMYLFDRHVVGFRFTPEYWASLGVIRWPRSATYGPEGNLPDTYAMSAKELAALMNDLRSRYGGTAL